MALADLPPMRPFIFLAGLLLAAVLSPASAEDATGRVRAIYYQAGPGVLVDAKMLHSPSAIRWADVDVRGRSVLVQMPAEMNAKPGDLVAVRLAEPKSSQLAQILPELAVSRAIAIDPQAPQFATQPEPSSSTGR
jgi:hypothetical protein